MSSLPISTRRELPSTARAEAVLEALSSRPTQMLASKSLFEADPDSKPCANCPHDMSWHFKHPGIDAFGNGGCVGVGNVGCRCPGYREETLELEVERAFDRLTEGA